MEAAIEVDDDRLMHDVCNGSTDAMAVLVARYHARLVGFCAKQTRDDAAAEELVQETFLRLWRARASYRAEGKLAVLLYTTARNLCRNHARSLRRHQPVELAEVHAPDPVDALLDRERWRDVTAALGELPPKLREAVTLRFEHQLAYDEIAAIVGANESTVRSRVHHAIGQLRARLRGRRWIATIAVAALFALAVSRIPDDGELAPRGVAVHSLDRDVDVEVYAAGDTLRVLHDGDAIAVDTPLAVSYRNLGAGAYAMVFAVDAAGEVHWIAPAYTTATEDPASLPLAHTERDIVLPMATVIEARGPVRVYFVVTDSPLHVTEVEAMDKHSLPGSVRTIQLRTP
jgi:RNA polymerase sigma-70 factor (ECF subfamily)